MKRALVLLLLLGGCYNPRFPAEHRCSPAQPACPAGTVCQGTRCLPAGTQLDAGGERPERPDQGLADTARDQQPDSLPPGCGDGVVGVGEQCDGKNLFGKTCLDLKFLGGILMCKPDCSFDTSGCTSCGNGALDSGEQCDGTALGGKTCADLSFDGGSLSCKASCTYDTSACTFLTCGDGQVTGAEQCDKDKLKGQDCGSLGFLGGTLSCKANCTLDTSACYKCGDGAINGPGEVCDGSVLGNKDCTTVGFVGGTLKCAADCKGFDTTFCYKCGDGAINGPGEVCDGSALGNKDCTLVGFAGGPLKCAADCKGFDTTSCYKCGDGAINGPGEVCDGSALGNKDCTTVGFVGGPLKCAADCKGFDTTSCYKCGDGALHPSTEQCDGTNHGNKTCVSLGFGSGALACRSDCTFSYAGCLSLDFAKIPKGTYQRGAPAGELCAYASSEQPAHAVTLTRDYEIAISETVQSSFSSKMGFNPSSFSACGGSCPVDSVSWHHATAFCNALSVERGLTPCYSCSGSGAAVICTEAVGATDEKIYACPGYRLPTDAEWERAYRGSPSVTTALHSGDITSCDSTDGNVSSIGWYVMNSSGMTHAVKGKAPNNLGLHDMSGNLTEWCHDRFAYYSSSGTALTDPWGDPGGTARTMRNGSYSDKPKYLRAAFRSYLMPDSTMLYNGFRCARSLLP